MDKDLAITRSRPGVGDRDSPVGGGQPAWLGTSSPASTWRAAWVTAVGPYARPAAAASASPGWRPSLTASIDLHRPNWRRASPRFPAADVRVHQDPVRRFTQRFAPPRRRVPSRWPTRPDRPPAMNCAIRSIPSRQSWRSRSRSTTTQSSYHPGGSPVKTSGATGAPPEICWWAATAASRASTLTFPAARSGTGRHRSRARRVPRWPARWPSAGRPRPVCHCVDPRGCRRCGCGPRVGAEGRGRRPVVSRGRQVPRLAVDAQLEPVEQPDPDIGRPHAQSLTPQRLASVTVASRSSRNHPAPSPRSLQAHGDLGPRVGSPSRGLHPGDHLAVVQPCPQQQDP